MPNSSSFLIRGLVLGFGFGVAVTLVHLANGIGLILLLGQPPHTMFALNGVLMELALAAWAGLLVSPVLLLERRGEWLHPVLLGVSWLAMERWVAVDPTKPLMWLVGPLLGVGLYFAGRELARRRSVGLVAGLATALIVGLLVVPEVEHALTVESDEGSAPSAPSLDRPDVLFIVMDTVRAQSSSTYGYARDTTPVLTEVAEEGARFDQATAPATWSLPAHASLFTGTFPSTHNAHGETDYLDKTLPTIAETFRGAGYETRCFSANPHISDSFGLTRGFDSCDEAWAGGEGARQFAFIYRLIDALGLGWADDHGGRVVVGNVAEWMGERGEDAAPAFVFVNFLEAHFPFHQLPDEFLFRYGEWPMSELREAGTIAFGAQIGRPLTDDEIARIREPLIDMYDGGIRYTDHLVGKVLDVWRGAGLLDDTIVVVLADHGEVVGEHKAFGHLTAVVEEDLHVPLVFRYPSDIAAGTVVEEPVSTVGVFATLAELARVPVPDTVQVSNLLAGGGAPVIAERYEKHQSSARFGPGEANGEGPLVNPRGRYRTYRSGPYKLVEHCEDGTFLFHLEVGEQQDLAATQPDTVDMLRSELLRHAATLGLPPLCGEIEQVVRDVEMSDEERCALCKLGYMSGEDCAGC